MNPRRILFIFKQDNYARTFATALRELHDRGHTVIVASPDGGPGPDELSTCPGITFTACPARRADSWRAGTSRSRYTRDYLRYLSPEFRAATKLRARAFRKLGRTWLNGRTELASLEDLALGIPSEILLNADALLQEYESLVPPDAEMGEFLRRLNPDALILSPLIELGSAQADFVKCARALRIPTALAVFSWDNLTTKGRIHVIPDRVFVWNDLQVNEAVTLHGVERGRVVTTGAPRFDVFCEYSSILTREAFCAPLGFDPAERTLAYMCSSPFVCSNELPFLRTWVSAIRQSPDATLRRANVLIRPHPDTPLVNRAEAEAIRWPNVDGRAYVLRPFDDPRTAIVLARHRLPQPFHETLRHADAVVGLNTSAEIEAGIVGTPVFTVDAHHDHVDGQTNSLHFHYLLRDNGGFVTFAASLDEHVRQLASEFAAPQDRTAIEAFVERFIRPHGWDVPAGVRLAEAILRDLVPLRVPEPAEAPEPP